MARTPASLALVALFVLVLAPAATPADHEPHKISLQAFSVGEKYWFTIEHQKEENPKLTLRPGETVEITLKNDANEGHNIRLGGPLDVEMPILEPGHQDTIQFHVPADANGTTTYWCQPHQNLGMRGILHYSVSETEESSASLVPFLFLMLGALIAQRRPAKPYT